MTGTDKIDKIYIKKNEVNTKPKKYIVEILGFDGVDIKEVKPYEVIKLR